MQKVKVIKARQNTLKLVKKSKKESKTLKNTKRKIKMFIPRLNLGEVFVLALSQPSVCSTYSTSVFIAVPQYPR